jgi:hypothetical protein
VRVLAGYWARDIYIYIYIGNSSKKKKRNEKKERYIGNRGWRDSTGGRKGKIFKYGR